MTACAQCGLQVRWTKVDGGWQCFNPDGSVHWDRCSAERFQKIKREGVFFDKPMAAGYVHPQKLQYTRLNATPQRGALYKPDGCTCGRPPWELCSPTCEHAIQPRR